MQRPSHQAIKAAGGDAEREAVRETVRKQRRQMARSRSYENPRPLLSPMMEDLEGEKGGTNSSNEYGSRASSSKDFIRSRSISPSQARAQQQHHQRQRQQLQAQQDRYGRGGYDPGYESPKIDPLTSGSSASLSADRSSSPDSGTKGCVSS